LEAFIRAKYEQKKYVAREWVPPKPSIPKEVRFLFVYRFINVFLVKFIAMSTFDRKLEIDFDY
jgi:hypothetical protein